MLQREENWCKIEIGRNGKVRCTCGHDFVSIIVPFYDSFLQRDIPLNFFLYSQISFLWSGGDLRQFLVFAASAAKRVGAGWGRLAERGGAQSVTVKWKSIAVNR